MKRFILIKTLEGQCADELYDWWTHCEITLTDAIEYVLEKGEDVCEDVEYGACDISGQILGTDWCNCMLVYCAVSGIFDVYELSSERD